MSCTDESQKEGVTQSDNEISVVECWLVGSSFGGWITVELETEGEKDISVRGK